MSLRVACALPLRGRSQKRRAGRQDNFPSLSGTQPARPQGDRALKNFQKHDGFTLIELLIVVAIIGILSLIHISEPTRLLSITYAVFCLKKKKRNEDRTHF